MHQENRKSAFSTLFSRKIRDHKAYYHTETLRFSTVDGEAHEYDPEKRGKLHVGLQKPLRGGDATPRNFKVGHSLYPSSLTLCGIMMVIVAGGPGSSLESAAVGEGRMDSHYLSRGISAERNKISPSVVCH